MKRFSIILSGKGDKMALLTHGNSIPHGPIRKIREETGIGLKEKISLSKCNLFYLSKPQTPKTNWKWVPLISLKKLDNKLGQYLCEALAKFWSIMPAHHKSLVKINLPQLFRNTGLFKEVIFFPGSFNPWHRGHRECLKLCPKKANIVVIPDHNPWKPLQGGICQWNKYRKLCLLIRPFRVYPGFLAVEKKNPTVKWYPKTNAKKRCFLMGDDSFLSLKDWKNARKLICAIDIIYVVPRTSSKETLKRYRRSYVQINPQLKVRILPNHRYQEISSTMLRKV